jgi:subtilisin family serine protease
MGGLALMEKEYIVILNPDIDFNQFNQEMISNTGAGVIPDRTVDIANARPGSQRSTHYSLTDEEAEQLKNDPRVRDVEIPPDQRDDIEIGLYAIQSGDFTKTTSDSGSQLNWGMRRCIENTNPYGSSNSDPGGDFTYTLDGEGVDVVIQDSGLQVDHPEFNDADGNSRVQQINWYTESGLSGTQSSNHYRDYDGHGTHVAGTAAGLTYGWAKNARIYSVKVGGLEGSGDSGGISISNCFDVIKEWHNNKPIDPNTGFKRPTIVNMSWGYSGPVSNVTSISYRGTTYNSSNDASWSTTPNTHMASTYGLYPYFAGFGYRYPVRVSSVDSDVEELIAAGVHVCIAAGNNRFKAEISGGIDYDNYFNSINNKYHRGSSPYSDNAMMVGSVDSTTSSGTDQISSFTTKGPGITLFAPGSNIRSAFSNTNRHADSTYYLNSSFKQGSISGTSMASPQVCGLGATVLQLNPHLTPAQLQLKLTNLASNNVLYTTNSGIDYADNRSLLNAPNKLLYTPFNSSNVLSVT